MVICTSILKQHVLKIFQKSYFSQKSLYRIVSLKKKDYFQINWLYIHIFKYILQKFEIDTPNT